MGIKCDSMTHGVHIHVCSICVCNAIVHVCKHDSRRANGNVERSTETEQNRTVYTENEIYVAHNMSDIALNETAKSVY